MKQKLTSKLNYIRENKQTNLRQDFLTDLQQRDQLRSLNERAMTARSQGPHQRGFGTPRGPI